MGASPSSSLHPLMNSEVIENISNGVELTLKAMAQVSGLFEKSYVEKNWKAPTEVSVYIELDSPPCCGQVRFHFSRNVLRQLHKLIMNEDVSADSDEVLDCVGEISNICYGYAKSKLNLQGYRLQMALPHPSKTEDLPQVISEHPHIIIPFRVLNETCFVEIVIL